MEFAVMESQFGDYDAQHVEAKWQRTWEENRVYSVDLRAPATKYFTHVMWPYPSGDRLHIGHWYNFGPADTFARYMRMAGKNVFSPMGFDAFGLPAENFAIKTGVPPAESTEQNVKAMITQLKRMGCMYDWDKCCNSSTQQYYRWTQWIFLKLFDSGLAYRKNANVNYCPDCKTVLANEQVVEGLCERCDSEVLQEPRTQWFFRTTAFAERLLDGLDELNWPSHTKEMQRNWIGRKEGINIEYPIDGSDATIECFTTRPDTNFGATFVVIAPEHAFVTDLVSGRVSSPHKDDIAAYCKESSLKTERDRLEEAKKKTGVFTGHYVTNRLNGRRLPIWVSDFVLGGYGTGAVVGVPGHDVRDFEFAKQYDIDIVRVVVGDDGDDSPISDLSQVQASKGTMVNSGSLNGLEVLEATEKIKDLLEEKGWGTRVVTYRLRDWLISRQRYWGAPIPIVYDPQGNAHPVPEEHLPWKLPTDVEFKPEGDSPLTKSKEFLKRVEDLFGEGWRPETDTMDTFVCSSFYPYRYLAEGSADEFVNKDVERTWMPVDMYIGGAEHICGHLIYARFISKFLCDKGYVSHDEPFAGLVHQGIITNRGAKMSKSRGNVVSPDQYVEKHGADVFRMYLMFMGPFAEGGDWNDQGINGISRFAHRVYRLIRSGDFAIAGKESEEVWRQLNKTIQKVSEDLPAFRFNTAISSLMVFLNVAEKNAPITRATAMTFVQILAPFAPHLAEELWRSCLGQERSVFYSSWPVFDDEALKVEEVEIAVQINGKVKDRIVIGTELSESQVEEEAKASQAVQNALTPGKRIVKIINVPGRLVNIIVK